MQHTEQIAKHIRDFHFGGNWTTSNYKQHLSDLTWQQATTKLYGLNSIAELVYHFNYYIGTILTVLKEGKLEGKDKFSFDHPPIASQADWERMLERVWAEAEALASLIEQLPDAMLWEDFIDPKYGNYYRNFNGMIEHSHYHLGQIVIIKKILLQKAQDSV